MARPSVKVRRPKMRVLKALRRGNGRPIMLREGEDRYSGENEVAAGGKGGKPDGSSP